MKGLFTTLLVLQIGCILAQPPRYTTGNVHSHNDYEQKTPFWLAYNEGFGSIEADIFLVNGELLVAHSEKELPLHRTLEKYYLDPLSVCVAKHGGHPFADTTASLQMLIDVKADSVRTLGALIKKLRDYPMLTHNPAIRFVISGNRPDASLFPDYPSYIWFDGVLSRVYSPAALEKIAMLSDNFKDFSQWDGNGLIPEREWAILKKAVDQAHGLHKPVRFWNAPDTANAWRQFMRLQVDYINTDHIAELSSFLKALP